MSLLIWKHTPQGFSIITDTMITGGGAHPRPAGFIGKVLPVPRLDMLLVGVGDHTLTHVWWQWLLDNEVGHVDILEHCAPIVLSKCWDHIQRQLRDEQGGPTPTGASSTLSHFVVTPTGESYVLKFRSETGFRPERIREHRMFISPPTRDLRDIDDKDDAVRLAMKVRREQDLMEPERRVWIGGELYLTTLTRDGFSSTRIHRFDDTDELTAELAEGGYDLRVMQYDDGGFNFTLWTPTMYACTPAGHMQRLKATTTVARRMGRTWDGNWIVTA